MHLADLGAEVIKIEVPSSGGDVGRYVVPGQHGEDSLFFETFNRTCAATFRPRCASGMTPPWSPREAVAAQRESGSSAVPALRSMCRARSSPECTMCSDMAVRAVREAPLRKASRISRWSCTVAAGHPSIVE